MLKISNFNHKRIGGDSRLQAFRDVFEFNNANISTKICFGLGEGIIFKWLDSYPNTSITTIIGRNLETEQILCKSLGINIVEHEETNIYKAKMILINRIEKQIPTIIDVDRNLLDYIPDTCCYADGIHSIVVIGYDEIEDKFAVTDNISDDPIWIDAKKLEKARNSILCTFLPKNKWYDLDFSSYKNYITLNAYYSSIKSVCINMKSRLYDTGINGMKNFYEEFNKTYNEFQTNSLNDNLKKLLNSSLMSFGMQIKNSESSNSFYRDIYTEFLKRLFLFTDIEFFNKYSIKCNKIALMWRKLGDYLSDEKETLMGKATYFINIFQDIIDMEEEFFTNLYEGLSQIYH